MIPCPATHPISISDMTPGQSGRIVDCDARPPLLQRLQAMGCLPGTPVHFLGVAPLGDPVRVRVGNAILGLRRSEARHVAIQIDS